MSHAPAVAPSSAALAPSDAATHAPERSDTAPTSIGESVPADILLDIIPKRLETLPGLSQRQRATYPKWATLYLRQLSWQDRTPSAASIQVFLDRMKERGVEESQRLMAREALMFTHDVLLRIPSTVPKTEGATDEVTSDELPSAIRNAVVAQLSGPSRLMARLAFATGMTPREVAYIRTGDVTLSSTEGEGGSIVVRDQHACCDRIVDVDPDLADALRVQLMRARSQYDRDREANFAGAPLPPRIEAIFPDAGNGWEWQFIFPSERRTVDEATGDEIRTCMGADHFIATIDAILSAETHILRLDV
jgi:integrase